MEVLVCENRCFPFTELLSQIELTLISLIFQRERMTFRNVNYKRLLFNYIINAGGYKGEHKGGHKGDIN